MLHVAIQYTHNHVHLLQNIKLLKTYFEHQTVYDILIGLFCRYKAICGLSKQVKILVSRNFEYFFWHVYTEDNQVKKIAMETKSIFSANKEELHFAPHAYAHEINEQLY